MNLWATKLGLKGLDKLISKVLKAREIKRLRDYVEKDNELDIQMKQVHKTTLKHGKTIEELEKDNAILKIEVEKLRKNSHPPVFKKTSYDNILKRIKNLEKKEK